MTGAKTVRTRYDRRPCVVARAVPDQDLGCKPDGLWYSVDGDWERWCLGEQPDWLEGKYVHEVTLVDEKILKLSSAAQIDSFHRRYGGGDFRHVIDWPKVSRVYDGIEIAPYVWSRRLQGPARWYYGWDCASGCIWRPKGVTLRMTRKYEPSLA